jgi:hypothetical protein
MADNGVFNLYFWMLVVSLGLASVVFFTRHPW